MGKISNVTNSNDPSAVNARIFVGNLNTFVLTKDNVENIFKRYGTIVGISMHKGYAFVQYASEAEARNAVLGEDQRVYATQPIDVNMTAEPKPNRPSRKRPPTASAEWDYFYNLPVQRINSVAGAPAACTPLKRTCPDYSTMLINTATLPNMQLQTPIIPQRTTLYPLPGSLPNSVIPARKYVYPSPKSRVTISKPSTTVPSTSPITNGHLASPAQTTSTAQAPSSGSVTGTPAAESEDILICGKCKSLFRSLSQLTVHKKLVNCKPACDCINALPEKENRHLKCASCQMSFQSSWSLLQHCQTEHGMLLFTEEKDPAVDSAVEESSVKSSSPPATSMMNSTESLENY